MYREGVAFMLYQITPKLLAKITFLHSPIINL